MWNLTKSMKNGVEQLTFRIREKGTRSLITGKTKQKVTKSLKFKGFLFQIRAATTWVNPINEVFSWWRIISIYYMTKLYYTLNCGNLTSKNWRHIVSFWTYFSFIGLPPGQLEDGNNFQKFHVSKILTWNWICIKKNVLAKPKILSFMAKFLSFLVIHKNWTKHNFTWQLNFALRLNDLQSNLS